MSRLDQQSVKHLVELRDIANAGAELAEVMGDMAYLGQELTEQQAAAWSTAFRCMGVRAAAVANAMLEDEEGESAGAELEGGLDAN